MNLDIMEIYLGIDLAGDIEESFSKDNIKKLRRLGIIEDGNATLPLVKIEEHGLISEFGIYEKLEKIWNEICKWKEEM